MTSPDPRDPRFKSFRAVSLAVYLIVSVGFSSLIIFSVYRSVLRMTPERLPAATGTLASEDTCLRDARAMFLELEEQRKTLGNEPDVTHSDQRFLNFRVEWLSRKRALEARCALDSRERAKRAFALLERVADLYLTTTVQFSNGVGPVIDALKSELEGTAQ